MKNFPVRMLVLCGVVAAGVLAMIYFTREPSADGRTLSEWLRFGWEERSGRDNTDVTNAVRSIGVLAIPILLDKVRTQTPAWKRRIDYKWGRKIFSDDWFNATWHQQEQGAYGFAILGTQAVAADPSAFPNAL